MTCTISKVINGQTVPFIRTNLVGVAVQAFMRHQRNGEAVRLEIRR